MNLKRKLIESEKYYKNFSYIIEKKLTVSDHAFIKNYAKFGIQLYILYDNQDNNRFLYISGKHLEEKTNIVPNSFKLEPTDHKNAIHLKKKKSKFGETFFKIVNETGDISIIFENIIKSKKGDKFFKKYKIHSKKIALNNPDWYIQELKRFGIQSHKARVKNELLARNKYSSEIVNCAISSLFVLDNVEYQSFNDHTILLDEGKTGKSSLVAYMGEKVDNVSLAGLYGSSDGVKGKFRAGLVSTTKKSICIDELNELVEDKKSEKVLSVINSFMENGQYSYQKQYSQVVTGSQQFIFLGNISDSFNLAVFLESAVGNSETFGRRIGTFIYNTNLGGFERGDRRPLKISIFLTAVSKYLSNLLNDFMSDRKRMRKIPLKDKFKKLQIYYNTQLSKIENKMENEVCRKFIKSHKGDIMRTFFRSLKLWIFENLDEFLKGKEFSNADTFKILGICETELKQNVRNFENLLDHINKSKITSRKPEHNKENFKLMSLTHQNLIKFCNINIQELNQKGIEYKHLLEKSLIRSTIFNWKRAGQIPTATSKMFLKYGLNVTKNQEIFKFRIVNKKIFTDKINGVFNLKDETINV